MSEFRNDLAAAKPTELLVLNTFASMTNEWEF
jgi:hypothetical protein